MLTGTLLSSLQHDQEPATSDSSTLRPILSIPPAYSVTKTDTAPSLILSERAHRVTLWMHFVTH